MLIETIDFDDTWLSPQRQSDLLQQASHNEDFQRLLTFCQALTQISDGTNINSSMQQEYTEFAEHYGFHADLALPPNGLVIFAKADIERAKSFIRQNSATHITNHALLPVLALEQLDMFGRAIQLGLSSPKYAHLVWEIQSIRLAQAASGNVTAFIDGAKPSSTALAAELPFIIANTSVTTINDKPKDFFISLIGWDTLFSVTMAQIDLPQRKIYLDILFSSPFTSAIALDMAARYEFISS